MKYISLCATLILLWFSGCQKSPDIQSVDLWKHEILETEKAFADMAARDGINKAFETFAADDAVLKRDNQIIDGKTQIISWLVGHEPDSTAKLAWVPDFVAVASSGDLGYTYGKFTYSQADSLGNTQNTEGIFHTVWKRQDDGTWKYVWD